MWPIKQVPNALTETEMWHKLRPLFAPSPRVWLRRVEHLGNGKVRCHIGHHERMGLTWHADVDETDVLRAIAGDPARQAHVFALCKAVTTGRPVQAAGIALRAVN